MKSLVIRTFAFAGVVCAGAAAHADSSIDIKNATQLFMNYAHVTADGVGRDAAIRGFTKPAGTLTFDIPASALGLPFTTSIHAVGTAVGNGRIVFSTSNTYSPPVSLGPGISLTSESGMFTMVTWQVTGAQAPMCGASKCAGGTAFRITGGALVANGSFGTEVISVDAIHGVGGVTRAPAGGISGPPQHLNANGAPELPVCSGPARTHAMMKVDLSWVAPLGGTRLDLTSTTPSFAFPPSVTLPQGRDTAAIDVAVPPNFVGTFSLTAAAGGTKRTATLDIRAASACHAPPRRYSIAPTANPLVTKCSSCSAFGAVNNEGDRIIAVNGVVQFAHGDTYTTLASLWGVSAAAADSINDAGQIAGRLNINGVIQAYRADMLHGARAPLLLGAMVPAAISSGGIVVGLRVNTAGKNVAVMNRGNGLVDVPLSSPYGVTAARALFINRDQTIAGTYTGTDGVVRGYRYRSGATTTLPVISGAWSIPVGLTSDGSIAVNAGAIAAVVSPTGAVTQYGAPAQYSHFVVKDINRWGYAVGTATCTTCTSAITRAFVYVPGSGFTALSGYVSTLSFADDALAINDDNQIAIHGQLTARGATPDFYLLSL